MKDVNPGTAASTSNQFTNVNGTLFFVALNPSFGRELWKSDGTNAGTVLVKDIWPGNISSSPLRLINFNDTLLFSASSGPGNTELWKSDGTANGTVLVEEINPGTTRGSDPNFFVVIGDTLFFIATDINNGLEPRIYINVSATGDFRWSGAVSTDWHTAANWVQNRLPDAQSVVLIPSGLSRYPIVSQGTIVKRINTEPGTSVTVNPGISLVITGNQ